MVDIEGKDSSMDGNRVTERDNSTNLRRRNVKPERRFTDQH
jgi:hypothetical protein